MKVKNYLLISCVLLIFFCNSIYFSRTNSISTFNNSPDSITLDDTISDEGISPKLASISNNEIIEFIFTSKLDDYSNLSYYSQIYEPSLQGTYYALFILNSIGKIGEINNTEMKNYIMSYFDAYSNAFLDTLAYRYLDTGPSQFYYPLSSVLETTCYAVFSLEILGFLNSIEQQEMIDFIWSCYNPISSGFIGQPYNSELEEEYKISTADNTFFAVITLDMLMDDWAGYITQRNDLIQFINDLQLPGGPSWNAGGFLNDVDTNFNSLEPYFEPNLLTAYYCIKTLEVFEEVESIRTVDFHQFLSYSYDSTYNYFHMSEMDYNLNTNFTNIIATTLGLELSDITNFATNRHEVIDFVIMHRNSLGNWDQSTTINHHELIDTFQIVRTLQNTNLISQLTMEDRCQIGNATQLYYQGSGYSLLSKDYTSMSLLHSVISSFDSYGRISELDIQNLYTQIKDSYKENYQSSFTNSFIGYLARNTIIDGLRSFPIEYYNINEKPIYLLRSHKSTFNALDSLKKLFKLDDFSLEFDLNELVSDIIATQFLNDSYYNNYGAFTPLWPYTPPYKSSYLNSKISFDYSYYAIRCLELIADQLDLGNMTSLGVDTIALYNHIERNIVETSTILYFEPQYSNSPEILLENTFYMIYVLKTLNLYNKDNQKIENFVIGNLNYSNIKNIYFSYKISEILDLNIEFDNELTHELIQNIYSEDLHGFHLTLDKMIIDQEILQWICEMARNSKISIDAQYSSVVPLGGTATISATISNLILRDFGTFIIFKYESDLLGTHVLNKSQNHVYSIDIPMLVSPEYFPNIEGILSTYEGSQKISEVFISISTTYSLDYVFTTQLVNKTVQFEVNSSILANGKNYSLSSGSTYTKIYRNDTFFDTLLFSHHNFSEYSFFNATYEIDFNISYTFEMYLEDGIQDSAVIFDNLTIYDDGGDDSGDDGSDDGSDDGGDDGGDDDINNDNIALSNRKNLQVAIPLMITFIVAPGSLIVISSKQLKKSKKTLRNV